MVSRTARHQGREQVGLRTVLEKSGMDDVPLANIIYFLRELDKESRSLDKEGQPPQVTEFFPETQKGNGHAPSKRITLYMAEEQQIFREAFQTFFGSHDSIDLVGSSDDTSGESLAEAMTALTPDIMLLGVKTLQPATVERLEGLRESAPDTAIVLLSSYYDLKGIKALREFSRGASVGCAYLLKHTIDTVEQLTQVISSVAQGRIILDPAVMDGMINGNEVSGTMLRELSPRETEVLSWMSKGYRNDTIADVLTLEVKTVERHINGIYGKLSSVDGSTSRHPRVNAILSFLGATGLMPAQGIAEI